MASTFTGLKLQGLMGHFGKMTATDIDGYVELPDGKVCVPLVFAVGFICVFRSDVTGPCEARLTLITLGVLQVLSGSSWGNLLLWDGCTIKVEICRKEGRNCHAGVVQPFALEDGQLMTMGSDGVVRVKYFKTNTTKTNQKIDEG